MRIAGCVCACVSEIGDREGEDGLETGFENALGVGEVRGRGSVEETSDELDELEMLEKDSLCPCLEERRVAMGNEEVGEQGKSHWIEREGFGWLVSSGRDCCV